MIKVGDIVKCTLPVGTLKQDKIYKIYLIDGDLCSVGQNQSGLGASWRIDRFQKIEGKELEEIKKREKDLIDIHKHDDPYGEEIWVGESRLLTEFKDHSILLDIIHNNILKSEAEFGLIIKPEDAELEKKVILSVFNKYKFKKWNEYSNDEYMKTFREVYNKISDQLEDQLKYYFYNTPEGKTKTRYNCHLESVISDLFRLVINNEAVKWYSKGKLTIDPNFVSPIEKDYFEDFITDNEFREFLIYNFCYDDYVASCEPGFKRDFKNNDREQFIDNAFSWDDSTHNSRGSRFWSNLDTKWNKKIGAYDDEDMDEAVKWYSKGKLTIDPNLDYNIPEYNDFITNDEFRDFLMDYGVYDEFVKYCHKKYKDDFNSALRNSKLDIIDNCLHWSDTPSGDGLWGDLNSKWNRNRY